MWIDDQVIRDCHQDLTVKVFVPSEQVVVCGRSNKPQHEVHLENCRLDGVNVLKRYGGGGTVVLHPGCLVISLGVWVDHYYNNDLFFRKINDAVIAALGLGDRKFLDLQQNGISDLVFGEKKIAGTSLFRSRHYLLYQASILVDAKPELMERYLLHPTREPEYRNKRSHSDFVIGLKDIVPAITTENLIQLCQQKFEECIRDQLREHLCPAYTNEIPHLKKKMEK